MLDRLARIVPPAFAKRRFRLFAAGQAVSIVGSWVQQVALSWLIYRLSGSVFLLGLSGFMQQIPHLVIAPVAGLFIDRLPRAKFLVGIYLAQAALAACLATLALSGVTAIWPYLTVALLIGLSNACEAPARQSLLGVIVEDRSLLPSAIGFNSVLFNSGRLIGPSIAALLLLAVPEGWCFAMNAVSFSAIVAALLAMRLDDDAARGASTDARRDVRATIRRLAALPVARYLLPMASTVALFALPLQHLMPSVAVSFFGGAQGTLGLLMSCQGLGALLGAGFLSMQRGHAVQFRLVRIAPFVAGLGLLAFSQSRTLWLSLPCLVVLGAATLCTSVSTNTLLQQSVDDDWRGRVIGLYFMCFIGLAPIGNFATGALAERIGVGPALTVNGLMILAVALAVTARLRLTPGAFDTLRQSVGMR